MRNNKFSLKKAIIASVVIAMVFMLLLGLLYSIAMNAAGQENLWIFLVVWGGSFVVSLIAYWIYQIVQYKRHHK
jgi:hypothetical protein